MSGAALLWSRACPPWLRPSHMPVSSANVTLSVCAFFFFSDYITYLPVHLQPILARLSVCLVLPN